MIITNEDLNLLNSILEETNRTNVINIDRIAHIIRGNTTHLDRKQFTKILYLLVEHDAISPDFPMSFNPSVYKKNENTKAFLEKDFFREVSMNLSRNRDKEDKEYEKLDLEIKRLRSTEERNEKENQRLQLEINDRKASGWKFMALFIASAIGNVILILNLAFTHFK